ncbi:hypothetical protein KKA53_00670 [Candidatus Dependentiae bacterium]|nr:hypothetical protein [Candidatus Dependentiae bacterium]
MKIRVLFFLAITLSFGFCIGMNSKKDISSKDIEFLIEQDESVLKKINENIKALEATINSLPVHEKKKVVDRSMILKVVSGVCLVQGVVLFGDGFLVWLLGLLPNNRVPPV